MIIYFSIGSMYIGKCDTASYGMMMSHFHFEIYRWSIKTFYTLKLKEFIGYKFICFKNIAGVYYIIVVCFIHYFNVNHAKCRISQ